MKTDTKEIRDKDTKEIQDKREREKIRQVMRWSGPRMIFYCPVMAVRHLIESKTERGK